ncbi:PilW family protein [Cupriavidus metallidurans]|uniref:PilW family protein n=1 Tax=Cupriavidus metallidurans TaxID=119219 RepID=UPI00055BE0BA|nr:PilW family protein [Cupriavidus metallidurans]
MRPRSQQHGFTLVGMMIGVALGTIAMLAALTMWQVMRDAYASVADGIEIEERGQRALAIIAHAIRHAGWIPAQVALEPAHPAPQGPLEGHDDCGAPSIDDGLECGRRGVRGSDALLVRFSGSGRATDPSLADGTMTDCSGYALPAKTVGDGIAPPAHHAATNVFYIGNGSDGVPQLLCRYPRRSDNRAQAHAYTSGTLVRGVESMQLRFGMVDEGDGQGESDRVPALLDAQDVARQRQLAWHHVRAVQVTLVVQGHRPTVSRAPRQRTFTTTVRLRNPSPCREALC